jgi:hypothetical protein
MPTGSPSKEVHYVASAEALAVRVREIPALTVAPAVREVMGFVKRVGMPALKRRPEPLTQVTAPAKPPAFYRDLGSTQALAMVARGGECAA